MMGGKKLPCPGEQMSAGETGAPSAGRCSFPMITCSEARGVTPSIKGWALPPGFINAILLFILHFFGHTLQHVGS